MLRNAAERTLEATWRRAGQILTTIRASECANYITNSDYASAQVDQALVDALCAIPTFNLVGGTTSPHPASLFTSVTGGGC